MAAALRIPVLRHALRQPLSNPRLCQRRWARVQDVRFLATHGTQERIMAKYKQKLESKAKEEGHKDVSGLKDAYKEKINKLRKEAAVPGATAPLYPPQPSPSSSTSSTPTTFTSTSPSSSSPPWQSPPPPPTPQPSTPNSPPSSTSSPTPPPGIKTLNSFLDLSKIYTLPEKEIQALWRLRHASNPQSLHFALPASTFTSLLQTAKQHPAFVLPLPREVPTDGEAGALDTNAETQAQTQQAAELHYLQFAHPHTATTTLLFTSLAEFKLRGEFASPHTTITFHSELADSHNLVLGQGTVMENRGVSIDEARWLLMCIQKFYVIGGEEGKERGRLLDMFTKGDAGFRVEKLLDEAEKIL